METSLLSIFQWMWYRFQKVCKTCWRHSLLLSHTRKNYSVSKTGITHQLSFLLYFSILIVWQEIAYSASEVRQNASEKVHLTSWEWTIARWSKAVWILGSTFTNQQPNPKLFLEEAGMPNPSCDASHSSDLTKVQTKQNQPNRKT